MRDEVGLAAHVDVALVGAAAQPLVQGSTVTLLLAAVQLPNQDVVGTQHFVLAVGAKSGGKEQDQAGFTQTRWVCGDVSELGCERALLLQKCNYYSILIIVISIVSSGSDPPKLTMNYPIYSTLLTWISNFCPPTHGAEPTQ